MGKIHYIIMSLIGSCLLLECKDRHNQHEAHCEDNLAKVVDVIPKDTLSKDLLLGAWKHQIDGDATFEFSQDSIDFFEFDPAKKYRYEVVNRRLLIFMGKYIDADSIKNGSPVLEFRIVKVTKDTLWLESYNEVKTYFRIDVAENQDSVATNIP